MEAQDLNAGQKKKYECGHEKCGYQTNKLFNFQRHRKIHDKKRPAPLDSPQNSTGSPQAKIQRLDIECAQQDCTYTGDQLEDYVEHVHSTHNSDLKFVDKRFDDRESLEAYLHKLQEQSACTMILSRTLDGEPNESFELCCSASGRFRRRRSEGGGFLESSGEFRSGIYCTFYLAINVYDNAIYVKGCESHFGHALEIPRAAHPMSTLLTSKLTANANNDELLMRKPQENIEEEDELIVVEDPIVDVENPKPIDHQSELRRIALDIQTETELFLETPDATLSESDFQELEKSTTAILSLLRGCRLGHSLRSSTQPAAQILTPPTSSTSVDQSVGPTFGQPNNLQQLERLQQLIQHQQLQRLAALQSQNVFSPLNVNRFAPLQPLQPQTQHQAAAMLLAACQPQIPQQPNFLATLAALNAKPTTSNNNVVHTLQQLRQFHG
ncbi:hypothetical protein M3Y96_00567400 [Aphelenchoides besseyi]|nr:hypothetical protein M3Y96_00567400 [Aphelenchoides besseyi]